MVKICNKLVKKVKKMFFFSDMNQGGQTMRHPSRKRAKKPNENFGASKCYLGPNFWNLAQKGQPGNPACNTTSVVTQVWRKTPEFTL